MKLCDLPGEVVKACVGHCSLTDMVVASGVSQSFREYSRKGLAAAEAQFNYVQATTRTYPVFPIASSPTSSVQFHPKFGRVALWIDSLGCLELFDVVHDKPLFLKMNCKSIMGSAFSLSPVGNFVCVLQKHGARLFKLEINVLEYTTKARIYALYSFRFPFFLPNRDCFEVAFSLCETKLNISAQMRYGAYEPRPSLGCYRVTLDPNEKLDLGEREITLTTNLMFNWNTIPKRLPIHAFWSNALDTNRSWLQLDGAILFHKGVPPYSRVCLLVLDQISRSGLDFPCLPICTYNHKIYEVSKCGRYIIYAHEESLHKDSFKVFYWDWKTQSPYLIFTVDAVTAMMSQEFRFLPRGITLAQSGNSELSVVFLAFEFSGRSRHVQLNSWTVLCIGGRQKIRVEPEDGDMLSPSHIPPALSRDGQFVAIARLPHIGVILKSVAIYVTATGKKISEVKLDRRWEIYSTILSLELRGDELILAFQSLEREDESDVMEVVLHFHLLLNERS